MIMYLLREKDRQIFSRHFYHKDRLRYTRYARYTRDIKDTRFTRNTRFTRDTRDLISMQILASIFQFHPSNTSRHLISSKLSLYMHVYFFKQRTKLVQIQKIYLVLVCFGFFDFVSSENLINRIIFVLLFIFTPSDIAAE